MSFVAGIPFFLIGIIFLSFGCLLFKKTDYSNWKNGNGIIIEVRDDDYDYDDGQRASAARLIVEFKDEKGTVHKGESDSIGTIKDVAKVKEKYQIGQKINFVYNIAESSSSYKLFKNIFGKEPFVPIHIEDDEFPKSKYGKYFLPAFGALWIVMGIIAIFKNL